MPRLPDPRFAADCAIEVDGRPVAARAGESVAVALLAAGRRLVARSSKYHRPRGAFCLAGSCHSCLARVDGVPNQRTCQVPCRPGLAVESQNALPTVQHDLLRAVDRVYARGLDHHSLMTWSGLANRAAVAFSRRLAGLGTLSDRPPTPSPPALEERFDALVVGAGPAGLAAAEALARAGRRVLLADCDRSPGGRLRCGLGRAGDPPLAWVGEVTRAVASAGGEASGNLTALGVWHDSGSPLVALRAGGDAPRLRLVRAPRLVLATGTSAVPPLFARNDLPGIFAARGLARALAEDGLVPGERAVVLGEGAEADALAERLARAGMQVRPSHRVAGVRGGARLTGVLLPHGERVASDTLAFAGPRAPACDLARQAGAAVELDPASGGFRVCTGPAGDAGAPGLWAAGEMVAPMSPAEAAEAGRRAGDAARG
jgi:sarcosine oxidase subunit alpha